MKMYVQSAYCYEIMRDQSFCTLCIESLANLYSNLTIASTSCGGKLTNYQLSLVLVQSLSSYDEKIWQRVALFDLE